MAAAFDNNNSVSNGSGANTIETTSWTISGTDRLLIAAAFNWSGSPAEVLDIKWGGSGGTSMTYLDDLQFGTYGWGSLYYLVAPAATSSTLHASWLSSHDERALFGMSFTGIDQSTPLRTFAQNTGTNLSPTATATSVSGDIVTSFAGFMDLGGSSRTLTSADTAVDNEDGGTPSVYNGGASAYGAASGATKAMNWTISSTGSVTEWLCWAVALIASAGGGGPTVFPTRLTLLGVGQ